MSSKTKTSQGSLRDHCGLFHNEVKCGSCNGIAVAPGPLPTLHLLENPPLLNTSSSAGLGRRVFHQINSPSTKNDRSQPNRRHVMPVHYNTYRCRHFTGKNERQCCLPKPGGRGKIWSAGFLCRAAVVKHQFVRAPDLADELLYCWTKSVRAPILHP